jgi:hypothetical protein
MDRYLGEPLPRMNAILRLGWRGPYIRPPSGAALEDGWKNPLRFRLAGGGMTVTSLGADHREGGDGFDRDITLTIDKRDWTGNVAGYISPLILNQHGDGNGPLDLRLFYEPYPADCTPSKVWTRGQEIGDLHPVQHCCRSMKPTRFNPDDGFFLFEGVPVGSERFLLAGGVGHEIGVEPGTVWLGTPGILQ